MSALQRLELEEFDAQSNRYDAAVMSTKGIDAFCSSSDWVLPALTAFHPSHEPYLFQVGDGYLAMARGFSNGIGRFLAPLEAMWGLASPFIAPDVNAFLPEAVLQLERLDDDWDSLWLCGLEKESSLFGAAVRRLSGRYHLGLGPTTRRYSASLYDGYEAYLGGRSRKFRANLRRAEQRSAQPGDILRG